MQEYKKIFRSAKHPSDTASHNNAMLIISNGEMKDIIRIVKSLEDSGLLLKGVSETIQNEVKQQKEGFLSHVTWFTRFMFTRKYFSR